MVKFIKRLINEVRRPEMKCLRMGHKDKTERRRVMIGPGSDYRDYVAKHGWADFTTCQRCRRVLPPSDIDITGGYTSISLATHRMDLLERRGWIFWD